jgi:predicted DNA-binding transcriptional regulator AlpA
MGMSSIHDTADDISSRGISIMPRVLRLRDVPRYLGMNRNLFNSDVRPFLSEVRIGRQGVAFDRLELDAWWEQYKSRNERRPKAQKPEDDKCQNETECRGSAKKAGSGKLKSASKMHQEDGSEKAQAYLLALRQSST